MALTILALVALPAWGDPKPKSVEVVNFADPQNVVGEVEVTNLPEVQDVNIVDGAGSSCEVKRFQLVGFTTATFLGTEGPLGFTRACDAEFPSSRWCTSAEVLDSVNLPALSGEAWVRGAFVGASGSGSPLDVTGLAFPSATFTCGSWSNPGAFAFSFW